MKRVSRRCTAAVDRVDQPAPIHLQIGPDHYMLGEAEAITLANDLIDAVETTPEPTTEEHTND